MLTQAELQELQESLQREFSDEADDGLADCEATLLALEQHSDEATVSRLKHRLHNLKGSASAVGFATFSSLVHALETHLQQNGASASFIDTALAAVDSLKSFISGYKSGEDRTHELQEALQQLQDKLK
jgi:two-component system chemotaxis sensor kinase CheA